MSACKVAEADVEHSKAELKEAKERQEEAHYKLRMLNESLLADEQRPLMPAFDQAEADEEPRFVNTNPETVDSREGGDEPYDWRIEPITELALPNALHAILIHEGIETMGQLEDLRGGIIAGHLEWPKGIGPAKVTLIEDRIMDWLEEHRNMEATSEDGQKEETPEEDG